MRGLINDLHRFGMVNAIALALMLAMVLLRRRINWRFVAHSVGVTAYTAWAAYGYVFGQNWALAILLQDWAAPAYQFMMILVSLVLADWLFLRGFFTQMVGNALTSLLPS